MEGWKAGGPKAGKLEGVGWKAGRLEGWKAGKLESWKAGRLEGWRVGRLEGWRAGGLGVKGGSGYLSFRFKQVIYTTSVILGPGPPSTYLKSVTVLSPLRWGCGAYPEGTNPKNHTSKTQNPKS